MIHSWRILEALQKAIPNLTYKTSDSPSSRTKCPHQNCHLHGDTTFSFMGVIMHLNDDHQWSREQIADWLETLDVDLRFNSREGEVNE